jgi:hypothetical protein
MIRLSTLQTTKCEKFTAEDVNSLKPLHVLTKLNEKELQTLENSQ